MIKIDKLFEILQSKNIPNLLLKNVIEIYSGNTTKLKVDSYQKNIRLITESNKAAFVTDIIQCIPERSRPAWLMFPGLLGCLS
jgi:hypothetical protein